MNDIEKQFFANTDKSLQEWEQKLIIDKLGFDQEQKGFILTKEQFGHLAEVFFPCIEQFGFIITQFHPKSGHIVKTNTRDGWGNFVYPTKALSQDFPYFRWMSNGIFARDWNQFWSIIKDTDCKYVAFQHKKVKPIGMDSENQDFFLAYDIINKFFYEKRTHIGGGRVYNESSAVPYHISENFDIVIT